jgi:hypothetical protein
MSNWTFIMQESFWTDLPFYIFFSLVTFFAKLVHAIQLY